eukprot:PhM_4_TR1269/c0_g1_i2/m.31615
MPEVNAPVAAAAADGQPQQQPAQHSIFSQIVTFFMFMSMVNMFFSGSKQQTGVSGGGGGVEKAGGAAQKGGSLALWRVGQPVSLYLYVSPKEELDTDDGVDFLSQADWTFHNLTFESLTENEIEVTKHIAVDDHLLLGNGSYYVHAIYTQRNFIPKKAATHKRSCVYRRYNLVRHFAPQKKRKEVSLLGGGDDDEATVTNDEATKRQQDLEAAHETMPTLADPAAAASNNESWVAHWQPRVTLNPVADHSTQSAMPENFAEHYTYTTDGRSYYPVLYVNNFWVQRADLVPINSTVSTLNVTISFYPLTLMKWMLYVQMDQSFEMQKSMGVIESEIDEMKRIFLETNPILLGVTMIVSTLHMLFEYLAFKNDISFWKGKKDFTGLSGRAVMMNCYFQVVICLYLWDGETSWTVLIPSTIGVFIEFWKLRKIVRIEAVPEADRAALTGLRKALPYRLAFTSSYAKTKTKEFDDQAMRYIFYACAPCLLAYTVYSAYTDKYKGWYSFAIHTQVRFIYFAGFVMMTPQIFINYKMKSVVHLPWRTFTYKALNTFIDDLFAFIIKMPMLHRLACLRDDVIFIILLYQRWIYPVDITRTEYVSDDEDEENGEKKKKGEIEAPKKETTDNDKNDHGKDDDNENGRDSAAEATPAATEAKQGEKKRSGKKASSSRTKAKKEEEPDAVAPVTTTRSGAEDIDE